MSGAEILTITLSTKRQLALPKLIRRRHHWDPGTRLIVEDTPRDVLLRGVGLFKPARSEDVFESVKVAGPPEDVSRYERRDRC
jgi:bifunctional DNA-binding transcriptional regulator/antitoxin component of YhaV-PrlF toxin-antitoxin module